MPRNTVPQHWYAEMCRQEYLYRVIIHNKLNVTIREPKETLHQYENRVRLAQVAQGYCETDYVFF